MLRPQGPTKVGPYVERHTTLVLHLRSLRAIDHQHVNRACLFDQFEPELLFERDKRGGADAKRLRPGWPRIADPFSVQSFLMISSIR